MAIKNVGVIGASGNVGAPTVKALLDAGFHVTAITRENSTSTFPDGVDVRRADLASADSLKQAFTGLDAVVSTVATASAVAPENSALIADAAIAAGVKRFVPSEFGHNVRKLEGLPLGALLAGKTKAGEVIEEKAKSNPNFTWTGVSTSLFFDWGLNFGNFGINLAEKSVRIFDSGNELFSATTLPYVGRAVAAVLKHEAETANKYLEVVEFTTTQNELLKVFEEETGTKFAVTHVSTADLLKQAQDSIAAGDYGNAFVPILLHYNFADGDGHAVKDEDNADKLLGLPKSDLRAFVKEYIKAKSA